MFLASHELCGNGSAVMNNLSIENGPSHLESGYVRNNSTTVMLGRMRELHATVALFTKTATGIAVGIDGIGFD